MAILSVLANPKDFSRAITPWKAPGGGGVFLHDRAYKGCAAGQGMVFDLSVLNTGGPCLVPRPHYYARPMRFGSCGPRKFLRPRQTRRSETFLSHLGGSFYGKRASCQ